MLSGSSLGAQWELSGKLVAVAGIKIMVVEFMNNLNKAGDVW
jgi:hypothetical protein